MTIITRFADGRILVELSELAEANYATGGVDFTVTDLRRAEKVLWAQSNTGLLFEASEYGTGNKVKLKLYQSGPSVEMANGASITGVTFKLRVIGH